MKRLLILLLCVAMLLTPALSVGAAGVSAKKADADLAQTGWNLLTEEQFQSKMAEMRVKYPHGDTWEGIYYEYGAYKADTCWAYACQMMYEFFGAMFYSDGIYSRYVDYDSDVSAGDWVRIDLYGGYSSGTHSIFITKVTESGVYYTDGNGTGIYNQIRWDGYYSWSEFNSKFRWRVHLPGNNLRGTAPEDWVYTIGYNGNGGSGEMQSETIKANAGFVLKNNGYTREGYTFGGYTVRRTIDNKWYTEGAGWQTESSIKSNGYTCKVYPEGGSYKLGTPWIGNIYGSSSFIFYVRWIPNHTVAYDGNGGSGSMSSDTVRAEGEFTLKENAFTRSGYTFGGYLVQRSSDNKWYTADAGWQSEDDIRKNFYTYKVYPEGGTYKMSENWLGGTTDPCTFTFRPDWIPEKAKVEFADNYSGYNYLLGSDLGSDYGEYIYSRKASVYTVSVDTSEKLNNAGSLKIVGKSAGSSGSDLTFITSANVGYGNGYSRQCIVGDDGDFILRFCAKASVDGANMYIRWGYSSDYVKVSLSKNWKVYKVTVPKDRYCGSNLHPYFDKEGTYYLNSLVLGASGTTNVVPETGRFSTPSRTIELGGTLGTVPVPVREGYTFLGWYTAPEGGKEITGDTVIGECAVRLYAHWSKDVSYTPVKTVTSNGHVYELYDNQMGWEEAEAFCEQKGGHLVTVDSAYENQLAYNMINDRQGYCWIGLSYDKTDKQWKWVNGAPFVFNFWYDQRYGTEDTKEYYALLYPMNVGTTSYATKWDKCKGSNLYKSYYGLYNSFFICEYDNLPYLGDADGNGIVDISDAMVIQRETVGLSVPFLQNSVMRGDVDGSGALEVTDATFVSRFVAKAETPFGIGKIMS